MRPVIGWLKPNRWRPSTASICGSNLYHRCTLRLTELTSAARACDLALSSYTLKTLLIAQLTRTNAHYLDRNIQNISPRGPHKIRHDWCKVYQVLVFFLPSTAPRQYQKPSQTNERSYLTMLPEHPNNPSSRMGLKLSHINRNRPIIRPLNVK